MSLMPLWRSCGTHREGNTASPFGMPIRLRQSAQRSLLRTLTLRVPAFTTHNTGLQVLRGAITLKAAADQRAQGWSRPLLVNFSLVLIFDVHLVRSKRARPTTSHSEQKGPVARATESQKPGMFACSNCSLLFL